MLLNTPKNIVLANALAITFLSGIAFAFYTYSFNLEHILTIVLFMATIFVFSYILISYSINLTISDKIKVIYRTIGKLQNITDKKNVKRRKSDVLDIVNQVVLTWSEEKKREIEELKEMAVYRREFLGNVSHELKTPIFNIQGYILTLLDGGINDETINTKFLKKSVKSINRMIALVEDLEEISKLETGDLKLKEESFNIIELTREVIDFLEQKATENKTTITINTSLRSIKISADKKRIRQVLINLIDNAIKYSRPEDSKINISFFNFHNNYLIEVQDNGIGIAEDNIKRIFERFYRTEESRSRDKGGTGLGLAIVKHIIEAHRQTISVRSSVGEGTTFSFTLKMG